MKRFWLTLVAATVLTVSAVAPAAAQDTVTIDMKEVDGSGQAGSADITTDGDEQVIVSIEIDAGEEGVPQPAHIHEGSCQDLGDVAYPLENVEDGVSESTVEVGMSELLAGEYAINVHLSEEEAGTYVSCGTLPLIGGGSDDSEDEAAEEDDESSEEDGDDQAAEEDEESTTDDEASEEDGVDQAAEEDEESTTDDDEAAAENEEGDDAAEVAPATGSLGDPGSGAGIGMMLLLGGGALGAGLLIRRRPHQA